jgi:hypothetical protein
MGLGCIEPVNDYTFVMEKNKYVNLWTDYTARPDGTDKLRILNIGMCLRLCCSKQFPYCNMSCQTCGLVHQ